MSSWKHSYLKHYATTYKDADLFFVCYSGSGLQWLQGKTYTDSYWSDTGKDSTPAVETINNIIKADNKAHYSIAFMGGGNDVDTKGMTDTQKENVASKYASFYNSLVGKGDIYAVAPTPSEHGSNKDESKRQFKNYLKGKLNNSVTFIDLYKEFKVYGNGTNHKPTANKSNYKLIDNSHYNKDTAKLVFDTLLKKMNVEDIKK